MHILFTYKKPSSFLHAKKEIWFISLGISIFWTRKQIPNGIRIWYIRFSPIYEYNLIPEFEIFLIAWIPCIWVYMSFDLYLCRHYYRAVWWWSGSQYNTEEHGSKETKRIGTESQKFWSFNMDGSLWRHCKTGQFLKGVCVCVCVLYNMVKGQPLEVSKTIFLTGAWVYTLQFKKLFAQ